MEKYSALGMALQESLGQMVSECDLKSDQVVEIMHLFSKIFRHKIQETRIGSNKKADFPLRIKSSFCRTCNVVEHSMSAVIEYARVSFGTTCTTSRLLKISTL
jgi:hypothetical protein